MFVQSQNSKPLIRERFVESTALIVGETCWDVSARDFWSACEVELLEIWVFNPSANIYANQSLRKPNEGNKQEKVRAHDQ